MRIILVLTIFLYFFWVLKGRGIYIVLKYSAETGISFEPELSREELMQKLKDELAFPNLKEINYDEEGQILLKCKYGAYSLRTEDGRLFIRKDNLDNDAKKIEEAECLKAYIEKLFNPDSKSNPLQMYNRIKTSQRRAFISGAVLVCAVIATVIFTTDAPDAIASKNISTSYLTEYSTSVTIGEAFDNFFSNPKWTKYNQGAQEYVDFSGGCVYGNRDNAKTIITFALNNDLFEIINITIDGNELPWYLYHEFLQTIYEE